MPTPCNHRWLPTRLPGFQPAEMCDTCGATQTEATACEPVVAETPGKVLNWPVYAVALNDGLATVQVRIGGDDIGFCFKCADQEAATFATRRLNEAFLAQRKDDGATIRRLCAETEQLRQERQWDIERLASLRDGLRAAQEGRYALEQRCASLQDLREREMRKYSEAVADYTERREALEKDIAFLREDGGGNLVWHSKAKSWWYWDTVRQQLVWASGWQPPEVEQLQKELADTRATLQAWRDTSLITDEVAGRVQGLLRGTGSERPGKLWLVALCDEVERLRTARDDWKKVADDRFAAVGRIAADNSALRTRYLTDEHDTQAIYDKQMAQWQHTPYATISIPGLQWRVRAELAEREVERLRKRTHEIQAEESKRAGLAQRQAAAWKESCLRWEAGAEALIHDTPGGDLLPKPYGFAPLAGFVDRLRRRIKTLEIESRNDTQRYGGPLLVAWEKAAEAIIYQCDMDAKAPAKMMEIHRLLDYWRGGYNGMVARGDRYQADVRRLRGLLQPFAEYAKTVAPTYPDSAQPCHNYYNRGHGCGATDPTLGDFRACQAELAKEAT